MNDLPSWEVRRILAPSRRGECLERLGGYEAIPPPYDPLRVGQYDFGHKINPREGCPTRKGSWDGRWMIVNPPVVRGLAPSDTGARIRRTSPRSLVASLIQPSIL